MICRIIHNTLLFLFLYQTRQLYFVTESALYELFKYASRYGEEISEALNEEGLSVLASSFVEIQKSLKVWEYILITGTFGDNCFTHCFFFLVRACVY